MLRASSFIIHQRQLSARGACCRAFAVSAVFGKIISAAIGTIILLFLV
jgi:hypothetical protein